MVSGSKQCLNIIVTDSTAFVHVEVFEHVHGGLVGVQVVVLPLVDKFVTHDTPTSWNK